MDWGEVSILNSYFRRRQTTSFHDYYDLDKRHNLAISLTIFRDDGHNISFLDCLMEGQGFGLQLHFFNLYHFLKYPSIHPMLLYLTISIPIDFNRNPHLNHYRLLPLQDNLTHRSSHSRSLAHSEYSIIILYFFVSNYSINFHWGEVLKTKNVV